MSVIVSLYHSGFRNNNHPILFIFSWFFNFYFSIYIIPNNFIYRNGKTKKRSNCLRLHIYFSCQIFNISSFSYTFMETKMMIIFIPICKRRYFENDYFSIFLISNIIYNYFDTFCTKQLPVAFYIDFPIIRILRVLKLANVKHCWALFLPSQIFISFKIFWHWTTFCKRVALCNVHVFIYILHSNLDIMNNSVRHFLFTISHNSLYQM